MTTLLRNPASFEGETIRVSGQYRSLPLLVCGGTTHRSPATWTLVFGDVETFVSGFDEALRPLAASELSLTVEGRWQQWEGPVGCGRRAPTQEIWYLDASRIVSPNPLVKPEEGDEVVVLPSPTLEEVTPGGPPTVTPEIGGETPEPVDTPISTPSPTFQSIPSPPPGPTNTPRPTATATTEGDEPTNTPTPTINNATVTMTTEGTTVAGTPTTTATATATPSPTTSGNTPSATATPSEQGTIAFDSVEKQSLAANSPHSWHFTPPSDEPIIITAGSALALDLSIELVAPDGTVVGKANEAGAGQPETITYTTPNPTGEFEIIVSGENGSSGAYLLMLFDSVSEPVVVIRDTLNYGSGGSGMVDAGVDHFWNFEGEEGDVITIEVSPAGSSGNLIFYLIGPDGSELEFIDETGVGQGESLTDYTLPATGFYSIGIGELIFNPVDYTMTLTE